MPSLRRSLIVYFLILVGLALGGLGLLIDRFASDALAARLEAETTRIQHEADAAAEKARDKFDADLLTEARRLAFAYRDKMHVVSTLHNRAFVEDNRNTFDIAVRLMPLGDVGNPLAATTAAAFGNPYPGTLRNPNPYLNHRAQLLGQFTVALVRDHYDQARADFLTEHPGLFQLHQTGRDSKDRQLVRSPRLPADLPTDLPPGEPAAEHWFSEITVPGSGAGSVAYRLVAFRSPRPAPGPNSYPWGRPQFGGGGPGGGRSGGGGPGGRPGGPEQPGGGGRPNPATFVGPPAPNPGFPVLFAQVIHPKADLDAILNDITRKRDEQVASVADEAHDGLDLLRARLALIGGATFLAVVFGGWLLTGVGLVPLRKLSDAVSRVSEKDFRLNIEKSQLTTELVPIHDRLTHSLDALRAAFEREKAAVADISHELRTPVAGMLATLDVALRKPRTADQYKETLTECRAIAKQLGNLVERVMTLAYLDAGHGNANPVSVDVSELAGGCATVIRPLAAAHGLTLRTDLPPEAEIATDPDRLREVLMNLLHNAIEYNRPGGVITLRAARDAGGLTVEVADTGIGMSDDVKARIFDRFFRADPSRTATGAHAGLGLAIVKEAVNRLGGSIAVDSTPAVGSTFRVRLPG